MWHYNNTKVEQLCLRLGKIEAEYRKDGLEKLQFKIPMTRMSESFVLCLSGYDAWTSLNVYYSDPLLVCYPRTNFKQCFYLTSGPVVFFFQMRLLLPTTMLNDATRSTSHFTTTSLVGLNLKPLTIPKRTFPELSRPYPAFLKFHNLFRNALE